MPPLGSQCDWRHLVSDDILYFKISPKFRLIPGLPRLLRISCHLLSFFLVITLYHFGSLQVLKRLLSLLVSLSLSSSFRELVITIKMCVRSDKDLNIQQRDRYDCPFKVCEGTPFHLSDITGNPFSGSLGWKRAYFAIVRVVTAALGARFRGTRDPSQKGLLFTWLWYPET